MSYNVEVSAYFSKQLKRLIRKYPSLKTEIVLLVDSLEKSPVQGTSIGKDCYKIRVAISSKGKGKSGGARVITHIYVLRKTVYLLSIYDKSEQANIPASILDALLNGLK
jgi:mRNA-degrading endonuclease RelE of RelBE toxin-antitoxin system